MAANNGNGKQPDNSAFMEVWSALLTIRLSAVVAAAFTIATDTPEWIECEIEVKNVKAKIKVHFTSKEDDR